MDFVSRAVFRGDEVGIAIEIQKDSQLKQIAGQRPGSGTAWSNGSTSGRGLFTPQRLFSICILNNRPSAPHGYAPIYLNSKLGLSYITT